jgi:hypothetical protein
LEIAFKTIKSENARYNAKEEVSPPLKSGKHTYPLALVAMSTGYNTMPNP